MKRPAENVELNQIQHKAISTLPIHSKIVLAMCIKFKNGDYNIHLRIPEYYWSYKEACETIGIDALTVRGVYERINELNTLGILRIIRITRWEESGMLKRIAMKADCEGIIKALSNDEQIQNLLSHALPISG